MATSEWLGDPCEIGPTLVYWATDDSNDRDDGGKLVWCFREAVDSRASPAPSPHTLYRRDIVAAGSSKMGSNWLTFVPALITAVVGLAGLFGLAKYLIEPWYTAKELRRKYATALWIACADLKIQLMRIRARVMEGDCQTIDALKKIPNNDSKIDGSVRPDWFTKDGYYTTSTAYKIAAVSAWLRIYQRELLFLPYSSSKEFLSNLYTYADRLNRSFSTETCLWYDYLNAVGDGLVTPRGSAPAASALAPLSFAEFCERYTTDNRFRLFYEQVHMYIWFVADGQKPYLDSLEDVLQALDKLGLFLTGENLLHKGFIVERPDIQPGRDGAACGITSKDRSYKATT